MSLDLASDVTVLRQRLSYLLGVLNALRTLHQPTTYASGSYTPRKGCRTCGDHKEFLEIVWPCATAALLDAAGIPAQEGVDMFIRGPSEGSRR